MSAQPAHQLNDTESEITDLSGSDSKRARPWTPTFGLSVISEVGRGITHYFSTPR